LKALLALLLSAAGLVAAPVYITPTNPVPVVSLGWTASSDSTVVNYFIYYGVASGAYTNKIGCGNVLTTTVTLPQRGVQYFFAATASDSTGLESEFSNEVSYTPKLPPGAPGMKPPVTLAVQTKASVGAQWADAGMNWSLPPDNTNALYRLTIVAETQQATTQAKALAALHAALAVP
jgi:hypothetical protein